MAKISAAEQSRQHIFQLENALTLRDETIAKLEKDLASAKSNASTYLNMHSEKAREIDAIHTLLDALPNPPPRKVPEGYSDFPVMTRLAVWLASRTHTHGGF